MPDKITKYTIHHNDYVGIPKVGQMHWHHDWGWEKWDGEKWVDAMEEMGWRRVG